MPQLSGRQQQINRVLIVTLILNALVAGTKIALGLFTGALAITADGFHSLMDSASNIVALIANTIAGTPPDSDHPYGHERFETLAALGIGLLLMLTAWETIQQLIERLAVPTLPQLSGLAFAVMLGTLIVNIGVNRYQVHVGQRLDSELLLADAAHTGTDVLITLSVLTSMGLTAALQWPWIDIAMALIVALLILRTALGILRQTGSVLVDTAPYPPETLTALVAALPGVDAPLRVRSRGTKRRAFLDIDLPVPASATVDYTDTLRQRVTAHLRTSLDGIAEVEVQFMPRADAAPDCALVVRACADLLLLKTHSVNLIYTEKGPVLDLHVEVSAQLSLDAAHTQATALEKHIHDRLPWLNEVVTHIEPLSAVSAQASVYDAMCTTLTPDVTHVLCAAFPHAHWHALALHRIESNCHMTVHAALPADMSIEAAHELAEAAERALRDHFPQLTRITIHTEPHRQIRPESRLQLAKDA